VLHLLPLLEEEMHKGPTSLRQENQERKSDCLERVDVDRLVFGHQLHGHKGTEIAGFKTLKEKLL